jgi:histidyl-tRNA synthetase
LVLVGGNEWAKGNVSVKDLAKFEQKEMSLQELLTGAIM